MEKQNILKARRIELGFTQEELAKKAGVSQAAIRQMENGLIKSPSLTIMFNLSDALKVPMKELWPETFALMEKAMTGDMIRHTKQGPVLIKYETWKGKEK